jgi:hypothetical protein
LEADSTPGIIIMLTILDMAIMLIITTPQVVIHRVIMLLHNTLLGIQQLMLIIKTTDMLAPLDLEEMLIVNQHSPSDTKTILQDGANHLPARIIPLTVVIIPLTAVITVLTGGIIT